MPNETLRSVAQRTYQAWANGPFASRDHGTTYVPGFSRAAQAFGSEYGFVIGDKTFDEVWEPPQGCSGDETIDVDSLPKLPNLPTTPVKEEAPPEPTAPPPPAPRPLPTEQPNTISYPWLQPGAARYLNSGWNESPSR